MSLSGSAHILSQFDNDLSILRDLVLRMGGLVEEQLTGAVDALHRGDANAASAVVAGDREIDLIELRSDEELARLLALRSPLGIDLRTVLTLGKTVGDLERIGDEAKKTARTARNCVELGRDTRRLPLLDPILAMAEMARAMLHGSLNALVRLDIELAGQVRQDDDHLDEAFKSVLAEGKQVMRDRPDDIDAALDMIFVGKSLERIGDHAKNITNYVHYLVEGKDVRHPKVNPATSTQEA